MAKNCIVDSHGPYVISSKARGTIDLKCAQFYRSYRRVPNSVRAALLKRGHLSFNAVLTGSVGNRSANRSRAGSSVRVAGSVAPRAAWVLEGNAKFWGRPGLMSIPRWRRDCNLAIHMYRPRTLYSIDSTDKRPYLPVAWQHYGQGRLRRYPGHCMARTSLNLSRLD
ncbi:hypothetical protein VTK56DRAFT_1382 [Thermocarpiscus australiensis]